jgi:tetratricopeptide (TPR) repeat protein
MSNSNADVMKKIVFLLLFPLLSVAQPFPDSTIRSYQAAKTDRAKGDIIIDYSLNVPIPELKPHYLNSLAWFKEHGDEVGTGYTQILLAVSAINNCDFVTSLSLLYPALQTFEKRKDEYGIMITYFWIGQALDLGQEHQRGVQYTKKAIEIAERIDTGIRLAYFYNALGWNYSGASEPDSGLKYAQLAVEVATRLKNPKLKLIAISTVAENYLVAGEYEIALASDSLEVAGFLSYVSNDLAQAFLGLNKLDSAEYHSRNALRYSRAVDLNDQYLKALNQLYQLYEKKGDKDSTLKYFKLATVLKDSIFSAEKTRAMQSLRFNEEIRQMELETGQRKSEEQRRHFIEYGFIAIGIITFIALFFLLSGSIIVNERWISITGVMGLLVVFEFINLVLHPTLVSITGNSPLLMLLSLVILAAFLIPLHHRIERWIKLRVTEKNKRLRIEHAKRTLNELEDPGTKQ